MVADSETPQRSGDSNHEESSFFDEELFKRVRSIEEEKQDVIDRMDDSISRIQQELESLKSALQSLPSEERRLMTVLVARSIKRSLREILLEQVVASE